MTDTEMILKGLDLIDDYCTNCNLPEEQDSIEPCRECAKQVLARHDAEVRKEAMIDSLRGCIQQLKDSDLVTFSQAIVFLYDRLWELKEQE